MRTTEKLALALRELLKEAEKSPVTITYRGLNDKSVKLYEVKSRDGNIISALDTESQIAKKLAGGHKPQTTNPGEGI